MKETPSKSTLFSISPWIEKSDFLALFNEWFIL